MKKYSVTVNGVVYDVTVEEISGAVSAPAAPAPTASSTPAPVQTPAAPTPAPAAAPTPAPAAAAPTPAPAAPAGEARITISAPMPGNILNVNVKPGDKVEKGAVLLILEAMKMENEIMAPEAGTVTSVAVSTGATVQSGDVLVTLA